MVLFSDWTDFDRLSTDRTGLATGKPTVAEVKGVAGGSWSILCWFPMIAKSKNNIQNEMMMMMIRITNDCSASSVPVPRDARKMWGWVMIVAFQNFEINCQRS